MHTKYDVSQLCLVICTTAKRMNYRKVENLPHKQYVLAIRGSCVVSMQPMLPSKADVLLRQIFHGQYQVTREEGRL